MQYVAERFDVKIKNVNAGTGVNNREALGWYDDDTVYLPTSRIAEAAGGALKEQRIAYRPRSGEPLISPRRHSSDCDQMGPQNRPRQLYALRRSEFGRTDKDTDPGQLRVVVGDD